MVLPVFARQDRSTGEKLFSGVFTKTATVEIQGEDGWHRAMCYVDEGASVSMIQQKIADKAKLKKEEQIEMAIQAVGFKHPWKTHNVRQVRLRGTFKGAPTIEILAVEEEGVSAVDDLGKHICALDHSPQLLPHFKVLLVWRYADVFAFLLHFCQLPAPREVGLVL